jgi:hypothetical protein
MARQWVLSPHTGGVKVPEAVQRRTVQRIEKYAATHFAGKYKRLDIRFRGPLCYVDAFVKPEDPSKEVLAQTGEAREQFMSRVREVPVRLFRLRHFAENRWSAAFFTYSNERYEPTMFINGSFFGTPEEAFEHLAVYLR